MRTLLIGNAPLVRPIDALLDRADHVIRFNKARGFGTTAGTRTDELWLINHGGQMAEWLSDGWLCRAAVVQAAARVTLPVPMLDGHQCGLDAPPGVDPDRINHLAAARQVLSEQGTTVRSLDARTYRRAQRAATPARASRAAYPSTGFIAAYDALSRSRSSDVIELVGFTFQGWSGHSWNAERRWVQARCREERLVLHAAHSPPSRRVTQRIEQPVG